MIFHFRAFTAELLELSGGIGDLESAIDWDMNLRMTEHTTPAPHPTHPLLLPHSQRTHDQPTQPTTQRPHRRNAESNADNSPTNSPPPTTAGTSHEHLAHGPRQLARPARNAHKLAA